MNYSPITICRKDGTNSTYHKVTVSLVTKTSIENRGRQYDNVAVLRIFDKGARVELGDKLTLATGQMMTVCEISDNTSLMASPHIRITAR